MPPAGAEARAEQLATLARIRHERLVSDELGRLLDQAAAETSGLPYESDEASLVRVARREWEKARRVPAELRAEITRASSLAEHAWVEARERSDFAAFLPHLERNVELRRRYAECFEGFDGFEHDLRPAAGRLRARNDDRRGRRGARRASRRDPAARRRARRPRQCDRRRLPSRRLSAGRPGAARPRGRGGAAARGGRVAPRPDRASVRDRDLPVRHPDHDPVRRALHRHRALGGHPRGRPWPVRERDRARALALAAGEPGLAGLPRVAEPHVGELGGARAALPGAAPSAASPSCSRSGSASWTPRRSIGRRTRSSPR